MIVAASLADGCAITPSGANSASTRQIICTMDVAGTINPNDYYFVIFNNANDTSGAAGPDPPIAPDWGGNGFVTGSATSYMEFHNGLGTAGYAFGNITTLAAGNLEALPPTIQPISYESVVTGTSTELQFRIPLSYLATSTIPTASITSVQINFINTNQTPLVAITTPKLFDALGNTLNSATLNEPITIPTQQDGTYSNSTFPGVSTEPTGQDVASTLGTGTPTATSDPDAPNLDITNWSVQITS